VFQLLRFNTRFLRARLREIRRDFQGAAALLDHGPVPEKFRSLRDAYRLRMLVLAHEPERGPEIISAAEALPWFREPRSPGDKYARDYCRYVAAAVRGDAVERQRWAQEVGQHPVKSIYRNSLMVTPEPLTSDVRNPSKAARA
jgi:hypothetical protein